MAEIDFDKERFCKNCCDQCNKGRERFLAKIEEYRDKEPEMVQWMEWYRDRLWADQVKSDKYRQESHKLGDKEYNKKVAEALRAMADKLEKRGPHFIVNCELPELPIFSGEDTYCSRIDVTIVAGPLGG